MEKLNEEKVLAGERFDVHRMTLRGDDGKTYHREVLRHPGAVVIIPLLDDGRVVLIRNNRPTVEKVLLELPAGTRETRRSTGSDGGSRIDRGDGLRGHHL